MFAFLRNWFDRMYDYFYPEKKKEIEITRNWNPVEPPASLRTTGLSRATPQDFYKNARTMSHRRLPRLDSAYNIY